MQRILIFLICFFLINVSYGQSKLVGSWKLYKIVNLKNKKEFLFSAKSNALITFSDSSYKGKAVCNFFQGIYNVSIHKLKFNEMLKTEVLCHGQEKEQEDLLFEALNKIIGYRIIGNSLVLTDQLTVELVYFKKK